MRLSDTLVVVRGGGDLGTGVAHRLYRSGFTVMVTELAQPTCVRRAVSFAEAVYAGRITVEGVTARLVDDPMLGMANAAMGEVPVVVDAAEDVVERMQPPIVVDARLAKRNLGTRMDEAPLVIGLGPGFEAGVDCHAVIETLRGHNLGRVYWEGSAAADTGRPEPLQGSIGERVVRAGGGRLCRVEGHRRQRAGGRGAGASRGRDDQGALRRGGARPDPRWRAGDGWHESGRRGPARRARGLLPDLG